MTIQDLKDKNLIIFEAIVGSQAHGTSDENSDIDIKGIFVQPLDMFLKGDIIEQIADEKNNNVYWEISKFLFLLGKGDPTAIELLFSPEDVILIEKDIFKIIKDNKNLFLTKQLKDTFGKYAEQQIRKARGLNKKIRNKMDKEKKSPIDFCYVVDGYKTYPLNRFLKEKNYNQRFCGIVNVPNAETVYALFYDEFSHICFDDSISPEEQKNNQNVFKNNFKGYKGIVKESENGELISNEIRLSSIPKTDKPLCIFSYNKNGYTTYCKKYKEYFDWEAKRNKARYDTTIKHGKGYDSKNMSHCYRLLTTCLEIGEGKGVNIRRIHDREKILKIKYGHYEYDNLLKDADDIIIDIEKAYLTSDLPEKCDPNVPKDFLMKIRKDFYNI
jgi:hypothetical protein